MTKPFNFFQTIAKREHNLSIDCQFCCWGRESDHICPKGFTDSTRTNTADAASSSQALCLARRNSTVANILKSSVTHLFISNITLSSVDTSCQLPLQKTSKSDNFSPSLLPSPWFETRTFRHTSCCFLNIFTPEAGRVPHLGSSCLQIFMKRHTPDCKVPSPWSFFLYQMWHNPVKSEQCRPWERQGQPTGHGHVLTFMFSPSFSLTSREC